MGSGRLTFGGCNKYLVERCTGRRDYSRKGEIIRFSKGLAQKPTQVNVPNLLNNWQATIGFIRKWFKKVSLVNKNVHLH